MSKGLMMSIRPNHGDERGLSIIAPNRDRADLTFANNSVERLLQTFVYILCGLFVAYHQEPCIAYAKCVRPAAIRHRAMRAGRASSSRCATN